MSEQTDHWRGLCAVLHDFATKFRKSNVKASVALDCASEEIFKVCRCLDESEARVANLEREAIELHREIDEDSEEQFAVAKILDRFEGVTIEQQASSVSNAECVLRAKLAELTKENELLRAELKKCVPMHFSGEISPEVDPDPGETETSND